MSFFVRKIEKSKWTQNDIFHEEPVSADAITICSKTKDNTLSIWEIDDISQIENVVMAMIASGDKLDTLDIVYFSDELLYEKGLNIKVVPGKTRYSKMIGQHRDIIDLNYPKIGSYAEIIVNELVNKRDQRYTVGRVKVLLRKALSAGEITQTELGEDIFKKLE
jgi:hypothetical protein